MTHSDVPLRWEPRVDPEKIRRLYESDARHILDEELLDEVAFALYARCESVLTVTEVICRGRMNCPRCARATDVGRRWEDAIRCEACGWETNWEALRRSY